MYKNIVLMSLSMGMRLLTGVVLFVLLARQWGADRFGSFMYWYTVSTLMALAIEYGFTQQILRDVGREPEKAAEVIARMLNAKIWLMLATCIALLMYSVFSGKTPSELGLVWLLYLASMFYSFADFLNVSFRAKGVFAQETRLTTIGNVLLFAVVGGILLLDGGPLEIAVGFLVCRLIHLALSARIFAQVFGSLQTFQLSLSAAVSELKAGFSFGVDVGLTNLYANLDTLLVNHFLGPAAVGLYQSAMRLVQGAVTFSQVLANVFLPKLAAEASNRAAFDRRANLFFSLMLVSGLVLALPFVLTPHLMIQLIYGKAYLALEPLLPWFGVFLIVRYLASSQGVLLTALGKQGIRAGVYALSILVLLLISYWAVPVWQLLGLVWAAVASLTFLFLCYLGYLMSQKLPTGLSRRNVSLSLCVAAGFALVLLPGAAVLF